jgi:hypothetical protein
MIAALGLVLTGCGHSHSAGNQRLFDSVKTYAGQLGDKKASSIECSIKPLSLRGGTGQTVYPCVVHDKPGGCTLYTGVTNGSSFDIARVGSANAAPCDFLTSLHASVATRTF